MEEKIEQLNYNISLLAASIQDLGNSLDRHSNALEDHTTKLKAFIAYDDEGNTFSDFTELSSQIEELRGTIDGIDFKLS